MTTLLLWIVGLLAFALLLTGRVAFVAWRWVKYANEDRYDPHALRRTIKEIIFRMEQAGDFNGLAAARDAMAAGFEDAEAVFMRNVRCYQRSRIAPSDGGRSQAAATGLRANSSTLSSLVDK